MPLPRPEATPPVTKMNFDCAFTTGHETSRGLRPAAGVWLGDVLRMTSFSRRRAVRGRRTSGAEGRRRSRATTVIVSATALIPTATAAATTTPGSGSTRYRPSPIVKPRRLAPPSPSMARSCRSNQRATADASTTPGSVGNRARSDPNQSERRDEPELDRPARAHVEAVPDVGARRDQDGARQPDPARPARLEGDRDDGARPRSPPP